MNNKEEVLDMNLDNNPPQYKPAMDDLGPVDAEANKVKQEVPQYKPAMDDLGPVDAEVKKVATPTASTTFAPKIESLTPAIDEATAIKETQAAQPNKIDDPSLKVEDEIKSSSKKLPPMTPEENAKDAKKKKTWLIALLVILGLAILILPLVFKIF